MLMRCQKVSAENWQHLKDDHQMYNQMEGHHVVYSVICARHITNNCVKAGSMKIKLTLI